MTRWKRWKLGLSSGEEQDAELYPRQLGLTDQNHHLVSTVSTLLSVVGRWQCNPPCETGSVVPAEIWGLSRDVPRAYAECRIEREPVAPISRRQHKGYSQSSASVWIWHEVLGTISTKSNGYVRRLWMRRFEWNVMTHRSLAESVLHQLRSAGSGEGTTCSRKRVTAGTWMTV